MAPITELQKKKLLGNRSSQLRTSTIVRTQTLDKSVLNGDHLPDNYNYAAEHNSVKSALRRCRSSGNVPPLNVRMKLPPPKLPQPPTLLSIEPGDHQVTITLAPPEDDGGAPITNYAYIIENASGGTYELFDPPQTSGPFVITGLMNGYPAYINFKALNMVGLSETHSNSLVATPAGVPSTPINLSAVPGDGSVEISFTQETDGGSEIIDYLYSLDYESDFFSSGGQTSSPVSITGLTNGETYNIFLKAVNAVGESGSSEVVTVVPQTTEQIVTFLATPEGSSWTVPAGVNFLEYLVVGGGGGSGGGFDTGSGGGGGGGMVLNGEMEVMPGETFTVIVGDGGSAGISIRSPVSETPGGSGGNSQFGSIIAFGGEGGYPSRSTASGTNGVGGAAVDFEVVSASKGGSGGGNAGTISGGSGGGGGGNSSAGANGVGGSGGAGGAGLANSISGTSVVYGRGGNGARGNANSSGTPGAANTGNGANAGGASSGSDNNGAAGGSGIVIIRFTIVLSVPSAPTILSVSPQNESALVSFTPANDNGSTITDYLYSLDNGATFTSSGGQT